MNNKPNLTPEQITAKVVKAYKRGDRFEDDELRIAIKFLGNLRDFTFRVPQYYLMHKDIAITHEGLIDCQDARKRQ